MALTDKEYDAIRAIVQDELATHCRNMVLGRADSVTYDQAMEAEYNRLDRLTTEYSMKVTGDSGGHHGI